MSRRSLGQFHLSRQLPLSRQARGRPQYQYQRQPTQRLKPGTLLLTCQGHEAGVLSVAWAPDGQRLASSGGDTTVRVWEADSGRELFVCQSQAGWLRDIAWSPDGARLASAGEDGTVRIWYVG